MMRVIGEIIVGLFEKQTILFKGTNQFLYEGYQQELRSKGIRFKAYSIDKQLKGGCCGLNCEACMNKKSYTYSIMVKDKDTDAAKKVISQFKVMPEID